MMNIYYLGRNINLASERSTVSFSRNNHRSNNAYSTSKRQHSLSSTRKTEPKYSQFHKNQSRKQLIKVPLKNEATQLSIPITKDAIRIKKRTNYLQNPCSSIQITERISFNKVAQAKIKSNNLFLRMSNNSNHQNSHRKCQTIRDRPSIKYSIKNPPKIEEELSDTSNSLEEMKQLYKIQPNKKIFFCDSCLLYLPIIQIKSHLMQCNPPKSYQHYQDRWRRVTQLLQQRQILKSNEFFRLTELMQSYIRNRPENDGEMLYSQELSRILNFRIIVESEEINVEQLFDIIQKIGDKLEINKKLEYYPLCS